MKVTFAQEMQLCKALLAAQGMPAEDAEYFHATFLGFQCDVDIYCIDTCVRKYPNAIFSVEIIVLHNFLSVSFSSFQE